MLIAIPCMQGFHVSRAYVQPLDDKYNPVIEQHIRR